MAQSIPNPLIPRGICLLILKMWKVPHGEASSRIRLEPGNSFNRFLTSQTATPLLPGVRLRFIARLHTETTVQIFVQCWGRTIYSQLSPCRHLAITDIRFAITDKIQIPVNVKWFGWKWLQVLLTLTVTDAKRRSECVRCNESSLKRPHCFWQCFTNRADRLGKGPTPGEGNENE